MKTRPQIGPFIVGQSIGRGGMGQIFEAVHQGTGAAVAIKFILNQKSEELSAEFHREVQAHASLVAQRSSPYLLKYTCS